MRIFLDNKGVGTLWSQFKAKLAAHAEDSSVHTTTTEKATWNNKAELTDIPTTLPANGGNADTLDGKHASEFMQNLGYLNTGSLLDYVLTMPNSGYLLVQSGVTDIPVSGQFFFVDVRRYIGGDYAITATRFNAGGVYTNRYNASMAKWYGWANVADGGNADTLDGLHANEIASNPNLLINPDFRINQRGLSEYSTGYTVDRWYISTDKCKATPESDGIRLTATAALASNTHAFWQNIEFPLAPGKHTLSLNVSEVSGVWSARIRTVNASGDYVDSYYTSALHEGVNKVSVDLPDGEYISAVSIGFNKGTEAGNSLKLAWAKLEGGSLATPFAPPDYAVELAKCQRYLYVLRGSLLRAGLSEAYSTSFALFYLYAPASFRTVPSVSFENVVLSSTKDGSVYSEAASIQVRGCNSNAVKLLVNAADSLTIGEQYELSHKPDTVGSIVLSAEL